MVCDNNAAHHIPFFEDQKAARTCVVSEQVLNYKTEFNKSDNN